MSSTIKPEEPAPSKTPTEEQNRRSSRYYVDSASIRFVQKSDSTYSRTPYYFKSSGKTFYYVCDGEWVKPEDNSFPDEITGMGLVDEHGKLILATKYHKIYNPDATAKGYVEIEVDGKKGLLNYQTAEVIPCEFDIIFPSDKSEKIAIGKKEKEYFYISRNGSMQKLDSTDRVPSFREMDNNWKFDAIAGDHIILHDSYNHFFVDDANEGNGVVFTPSYLQAFGFLPEVHNYLIQGKSVEFGTTASRGKLLEKKSLSEKVMALMFFFYEEGIDGRGHAIQNHQITTIDSTNKVIATKEILNESLYYRPYYCSAENSGYKFINDSILEVYEVKGPEEGYERYDIMTIYTHYLI